jgi:2-dehydro-3-deoxyphosphogluconate aldolase / (4S)-4-hydroxy-2-oxoglutarate aldolase
MRFDTALLRGLRLLPVVTIDDPAQAVPLARALLAGGVHAIEVTLRTPRALDAIRALAQDAPEMLTGAGTIRTPSDAEESIKAGARFLVSPGAPPNVTDAFRALGAPALPGAATITEAMRLFDLGFGVMKFFPAEANGGAPVLKAWSEPCPELLFCPTGGVSLDKAPTYLSLPNVPFAGGTWIASRDAIAAGDWAGIEANARKAAGFSASA